MTAPADALSCLSRAGEKPPFFCVPGAATTPLSLHPLSRQLAPERPVFSFKYMGVDDDSPVETTIEGMAQRLVDAMLDVWPSGPYLLGGYCLGGLVAFEAAAVLRSRGAPVPLLALLEAIPPLAWADTGQDTGEGRTAVDTASLGQALTAMESHAMRQLDSLPAAIAEHLRQARSLHNRAGAAYVPRRVDAPVVLFRTSSHNESVFDAWPQLTSGGFSSVTVDGDTQSMLTKPAVVTLGDRLRAALTAAG